MHQREDGTFEVGGLVELAALNAAQVRDEIKSRMGADCLALEMDLASVTFLDSSGLGTLISLHKALRTRGGEFRIVNAAPNVLQILELTRLHRVFQIITR